ncbi:hypothetical protein LSAT2_008388 [Lamellibrachia satsuma]|nr:hypothetical protein LSAT2_008388 [Lamellibrachia satsuma]
MRSTDSVQQLRQLVIRMQCGYKDQRRHWIRHSQLLTHQQPLLPVNSYNKPRQTTQCQLRIYPSYFFDLCRKYGSDEDVFCRYQRVETTGQSTRYPLHRWRSDAGHGLPVSVKRRQEDAHSVTTRYGTTGEHICTTRKVLVRQFTRTTGYSRQEAPLSSHLQPSVVEQHVIVMT